MKLLDKKTGKEEISDKVAGGIARGILNSQNFFAKGMQAVTKNWKEKQQWTFLSLLCLGFGGLSILAVVHPFTTLRKNNVLVPKSIAIPKSIHQQNKSYVITEREFQQVQEYKIKYPDLQEERPGLFDSLSLIEELYYSQKK